MRQRKQPVREAKLPGKIRHDAGCIAILRLTLRTMTQARNFAFHIGTRKTHPAHAERPAQLNPLDDGNFTGWNFNGGIEPNRTAHRRFAFHRQPQKIFHMRIRSLRRQIDYLMPFERAPFNGPAHLKRRTPQHRPHRMQRRVAIRAIHRRGEIG